MRCTVFGPGVDEALVWYEGSGTTDRRFLVADERGSIVAVTNASGAASYINTYDEYGTPGAANTGRFQYTGQAWLPEAQLYHFKARVYIPALGRFAQTDPILFAGGINVYAYAGNAPLNFSDTSGLDDTVTVIGDKRKLPTGRFLMNAILQTTLEPLAPGGVALFQAPTYGANYKFELNGYLNHVKLHQNIEMHCLAQSEIFDLVQEKNCRVQRVREDRKTGHAGMFVSSTFLLTKRA